MDTYSKILELNEYFQPAYDLTNELRNYWKQFIPNDKFFAVLRGVLNSLEGQQSNEKNSLWLQGTYGTGKSHATAVIKHLLFDDVQDLEPFIANFEDTQLKSRTLHFRENSRLFPVVLKGTSNITDNRTFALVLEKGVKHALRQNDIEICTRSDFERMVHHIETNPGHINWDKVIQSYPQLSIYVKNKEDLIRKLKDEDLSIIKNVEALSSVIGIHFSHSDISSWLTEVSAELRQQEKAESLMIYWDEFTSVLELPNSGVLLSELQNIAELSTSHGIYLFMVSHRTPLQAKIAREDMEKVLGRFKMLDYSMEPITTYHIMGASIHKKDRITWEHLRDEKFAAMDSLIRRIVGTEGGVKDYNLLKDLFPIHPYTAYLATFIARNIGSTERSIFNFLYDKEKGFFKFIQNYPSDGEGILLTAEYLWDYFAEEFERIDYQRFASILDRYKLHIARVEQENQTYSAIFKGVLLLNVQYKMVNVAEAKETLVAPSLSNIKSMFWGTEYAQEVEAALTFFHEQQIISKNPDNLFLIISSSLPYREVEKEKDSLKSFYDSVEKILSRGHIEELQTAFTSSILRQTELKLFDASLNGHLLKSKLKKAFKDDYSLHIAAIIAQKIQDREQIKTTGKRILEDPEFGNIIFVVFEELLGEQVMNQFIDYLARAKVAERLTLKDEQAMNEEYAQKVLGQWIHSLKSGYVEWFVAEKNHIEKEIADNIFGKKQGKVLINDFSEIANDELSAKIFRFGLENLREVKRNQNVWTVQMAKASADSFLSADNREFIEQKTASGPSKYIREILKNDIGEYIVDENLVFKTDLDVNHPLVKMSLEVENAINRKKNSGVFNLGDTLGFLAKPPFGIYPNMAHFAALGFLMRNYIGKLYEAGKGKPVEKEIMRDKILDLFNYWKTGKGANKLEVRLGTKDEKQLITDLTDIFELTEIESLNDVKWGIRNWIKESQYPLWAFKLSEHSSKETTFAINKIIALIESRDAEISYTGIKITLSAVKAVETDLKLLIFKKERSRDLFIKWLKTIENVELQDEKIDDVITYIRHNMPEEIGVASWKEDNVREKVKDWYIQDIEQSQPKPSPHPSGSEEPSYPLSTQAGSGKVNENNRNIILAKIDAYQGNLKELLKKVIREHEEIIALLEKYF